MRAAVLLALMIIASGCLGGADTNPKNDPRPEPTSTPTTSPPPPPPASPRVVLLSLFQFTGCSGVEAHYAVAPAAARALVPEGFTLRSDQGTTGDQALARYRIFSCPQFSSSNILVNETVYGDVALLIEDPAIEETGERDWYRLRIFSADDVLAKAWVVSGYDVATGEVVATRNPLNQQTLAFAGYQAQWLSSVNEPVAAEEVSFTNTTAGVVVWGEVVAAISPTQLGIGTFSIPSDDPLSGIVGGDPSGLRLVSHANTDIVEARLVLITPT